MSEPGARPFAGVTLFVTALLFLGGGWLGFKLLTAQAETVVDAGPSCQQTTIQPGEKLTSNLVRINVFNASGRSGLANRVSINLQAQGFQSGQIGNSTSETEPDNIAILTDDPDDPMVKLAAAQFSGKIDYGTPDINVESGLVVILGSDFKELKKDAPAEIEANRAVTVCVPRVTLD